MEPIRKVTETDIIDRFIGELEVDCEWQKLSLPQIGLSLHTFASDNNYIEGYDSYLLLNILRDRLIQTSAVFDTIYVYPLLLSGWNNRLSP